MVGFVLTAEQLAERPDLLYGRVTHRHGHLGHERRASGGRSRRGGRGRSGRRLLLGGRIFFLRRPRFRRSGHGRSAVTRSGRSVDGVQRFGGRRH